MAKVSIVIPVYNAEKYLNACVESIRSQTFHEWEALLVDDGSTDGSYGIASDYAQKDSRIKVFSNKQKGVSSARNLGVSMASGEYIMFVDSDDTVEAHACESLLSAIQNYDLAVSAYRIVYGDGRSEIHNIDAFAGSMRKFCCCIDGYIEEAVLQGPWCKLFKRNIIAENRVLFPEHFSYGEDAYFVYSYMKHIKTINVIPIVTYNYLVREKSLSHRFRTDRYEIHVTLNRMICDVCKQFGLEEYEEKQNMLNRNVFAVFLSECATCKNREEVAGC